MSQSGFDGRTILMGKLIAKSVLCWMGAGFKRKMHHTDPTIRSVIALWIPLSIQLC